MAAPDYPHNIACFALDAITGILPFSETECAPALDAIGVADPADRARLSAFLIGYALEYRFVSLGEVSRPRGREIIDALGNVAKAAQQIDDALLVLRRARQTAFEGGGAREDYRQALFPMMVESVQAAFRLPRTEWKGGFEDPLTGGFAQIADAAADLADRFTVEDVRAPTRQQHPGLTLLILRLAGMYEEWTGRRPTAAQNSEQPEYRTPFVRFVHAFAPLAGVASDLAPKSIRAALSSRLPQKYAQSGRMTGLLIRVTHRRTMLDKLGATIMKADRIEPHVVPISTARQLLGGLSRSTIYAHMGTEGGLEGVKIAGRRMITMRSIKRMTGGGDYGPR
ncbi:hypothetical protein Sj15T_01660 [Sphingobium sp. TA15]|uniref:Uncharacterized protein n=2 Tax=Sphingobium TaxID=165695 RepID=D4YZP5_SPHIU|nr:hypothetical protein [Sphingobium indicum]BAI95827.1 hypothetical protein SJA_C1-09930 [Sphingobium indicum UT26S]BDD65145.1 hypothetical protein Sj15T_01660 [Sphingobium sp. TA15]